MATSYTTDKLLSIIQRLQLLLSNKETKRLQLSWVAKAIEHADSLAPDDEELQTIMQELSTNLDHYNSSAKQEKRHLKQYYKTVGALKAHLRRKYNLIEEQYYTGVYMALGMSTGILLASVAGILFADIIAIALPIGMMFGMSLGILYGSILDNKAKSAGTVVGREHQHKKPKPQRLTSC